MTSQERLSFLDRLRTAGIAPGDDDDLRLSKSLLVLATGLVSIASMPWLLIYWRIGNFVTASGIALWGLLAPRRAGGDQDHRRCLHGRRRQAALTVH